MSFSELSPPLAYWRSLTYFSVYRLVIAGLVIATVQLRHLGLELAPVSEGGWLFEKMAWLYVLACASSLVAVVRWRQRFNLQLGFQVGVDIVVFVVLLHAAGGLHSGIGVLLLVSLAGAGLVGQGRLALSYAALATLVLLGQQVYQSLGSEFYGAAFVQAGALSLGFFAVAILARLLASRVVASEKLARQRGLDLKRQLNLNARVIAMLDDGIIVVSAEGEVFQANPRAQKFLGLSNEMVGLVAIHSGLARSYALWRATGQPESHEFRAGVQRTLLIARFIDVPDAEGDALIFLQDVGEQREISQRQKLAALGRLTGGIAHEIRNPLSAIQYAAELLKEDNRSVTDRRMLDIVLDNALRLERIVRDVLELGRRDRANPQVVKLQAFLPTLVSEFVATSGWSVGRVTVDVQPSATIRFDPSHLRQVLSNLLGNAGRYGSSERGAIRIRVDHDPARIAVEDDGPGIAPEVVIQLFEPFFTTHPQGNGLGLYIARELCEANGARLHYERADRGACFVIYGDV